MTVGRSCRSGRPGRPEGFVMHAFNWGKSRSKSFKCSQPASGQSAGQSQLHNIIRGPLDHWTTGPHDQPTGAQRQSGPFNVVSSCGNQSPSPLLQYRGRTALSCKMPPTKGGAKKQNPVTSRSYAPHRSLQVSTVGRVGQPTTGVCHGPRKQAGRQTIKLDLVTHTPRLPLVLTVGSFATHEAYGSYMYIIRTYTHHFRIHSR